jgi:hypothetical protein
MDGGLHIHHPKHTDVAQSYKTAGKTHVFGFSGGTPMDERGMVRISHIWPYGAKPADSCLAGRAVPQLVAPACRNSWVVPCLPLSLSPLPSFSPAHGSPHSSAMLWPAGAAEAPPACAARGTPRMSKSSKNKKPYPGPTGRCSRPRPGERRVRVARLPDPAARLLPSPADSTINRIP